MGKARKHFDKWYRENKRGLAAGLLDMRLIAQSAFNEGVKFATTKNPMHKPECICNTKGIRGCDCGLIKPIRKVCAICGGVNHNHRPMCSAGY